MAPSCWANRSTVTTSQFDGAEPADAPESVDGTEPSELWLYKARSLSYGTLDLMYLALDGGKMADGQDLRAVTQALAQDRIATM